MEIIPRPPSPAYRHHAAGNEAIRRLRRLNRSLKALDAIGMAASSTVHLEDMLGRVLRALLEMREVQAASIALPDARTQQLDVYAAQRTPGSVEMGFRRLDLLRPSPAASAAPELSLDEVQSWPTTPLAGRQGTLWAALTINGRILGRVTIDLGPVRHPTLRWRHWLSEAAARIALALDNARTVERLQQDADRLAALSAVNSAMREAHGARDLLARALQELLMVTDLELGAIHLCCPGTAEPTLTASSGISPRLAERLSAGLAPFAAVLTAPRLEEDLPVDPNDTFTPQPRCLVHLPLRSNERLLGILTIGSCSQPEFAPDAVRFLERFADPIALNLDNAYLQEGMTERARQLAEANEALREALRSKDEFLAIVTHELKRPLAPIRIVLELLLRGEHSPMPPKRQQELLQNALSNVDDMTGLVSQLLETVRLQGHGTALAQQGVSDLGAILQRCVAVVRPLAESQRLQLHTLLPPEPILVRVDAESLGRVFDNLLSNALKFNRPGGSVLVQLELSADGSQAITAVSDTGMGIPAHAQAHVFERFYQADASATRQHEGLGLGLFIAKETVERHGGQITFNTVEGEGATFTVTLPAEKA
jgi:signal transduction histidine kinase